jgi:hypothetical protein
MTSPEPVLDTARIWVLAEELDSRAAALEFITAFLRMLPERVARINHTLEMDDRDHAMDAVLSLASSASMAGAHQHRTGPHDRLPDHHRQSPQPQQTVRHGRHLHLHHPGPRRHLDRATLHPLRRLLTPGSRRPPRSPLFTPYNFAPMLMV